MTSDTRKLLDFLSDSSNYDPRPTALKLVQTHASWVVLADPFVYKIKKPVKFSFLDFSTLDLRQEDCEREVLLNRRLAEDMYLGVLPICEDNGMWRFASSGRVVEWVVKMRLLPQEAFLNHLLEADQVGESEVERVVKKLEGFYATTPPLTDSVAASAPRRTQAAILENLQRAEPFVGQTLSHAAHAALELYSKAFYRLHFPLLEKRFHQGWVRDCHGDLHSEHIHLADDQVRIYDCIEFNSDFRVIDVACDLAFLAMDFEYHGRPGLATYLVRRFAELHQDTGMPGLMDYYKCYRAAVRGTVECLHAVDATTSADEARRTQAIARRYFQLALRYAVLGSSATAVVFMGRTGSGKSALAKAMQGELGLKLISSDVTRKSLAGVPLTRRGDELERRELYTDEFTEKTYEALQSQALAELRRGCSVLLDASFSRLRHREGFCQKLQDAGFRIVFVWVQADPAVRKERLEARNLRRDEVSDARTEDQDALDGTFEEPDELSFDERLDVQTHGAPAQTAAALLLMLARRRAEQWTSAGDYGGGAGLSSVVRPGF